MESSEYSNPVCHYQSQQQVPEQIETSDIDFGNLYQKIELDQRELSILDMNEEGSSLSEDCWLSSQQLKSGRHKKRDFQSAESIPELLVDNDLYYYWTDPKAQAAPDLDF